MAHKTEKAGIYITATPWWKKEETMKKMNQWEMAKQIKASNGCGDLACRKRASMLQEADCPLCSMPNKWSHNVSGCILQPGDKPAEKTAEWMNEHPELNPALHMPEREVYPEDRLNQDCGVKRIWPDTPVRDPANWLSDSNLMLALADELDRAEKLHPDWPKDLVYQAAIVMEEAGEFMQAVMNHRFHDGAFEDVVREIQQVGAMALRFLKNASNAEDILAAIKTGREEGHE